jgi:tRNA pseudouridine38-40 synthase
MRLKLTLQYLGTGLHGWQHQVEGGIVLPTVEGHLLKSWKDLTGEDVDFTAAGRTDGGVHALEQVCHVDTNWAHAGIPIKVWDGLNHYLPPTIRITRVAVVDEAFHARFHAVARHYKYILFNRRTMRPDWQGRAGHHVFQLDIAKLQAALHHLPLGEHDFSAFRDAECQSQTPMCNLLARAVTADEEGFITLTISANHFLHHMVRNIVGTLAQIGQGERPVDDLPRLLATRDRTQAGPTFGPEGLYLTGVDYRPHSEQEVAGLDLQPHARGRRL